MKSIVSYASGGLANRLLPLSSCVSYARKKGVTPVVCWEKTFSCGADFCDLFEPNDVKVIKKDQLRNKIDTLFILSPHDVHHDCELFGNTALLDLYQDKMVRKFSVDVFSDDYENCCVYSNDFIGSIDSEDDSRIALKSFVVKKDIQEKIDMFTQQFSINKQWISIHARGTDFPNSNLNSYVELVKQILQGNKDIKIFVCSDEPSWEEELSRLYPNNVIYRKKENHITKSDPSNPSWSNNIFRSEEQIKEAMIDLYLLSLCGRVIYDQTSSFGRLASLMVDSNENH